MDDGNTTAEEKAKIKKEPMDNIYVDEFVNSDKELLVKVEMQLEGITEDNRNECENNIVHVKVEELSDEDEEFDNNPDELNAPADKNSSKKLHYNCETCRRNFKTVSGLNKHECNVICELCNKSFTAPSLLKIHYLSHSGEKPFKCDKCGKKFTQKSHLKTHVKIHDVAQRDYYKCEDCGKKFTQNGSLTYHRKIHANDKPCLCEVCGKRFTFPKDLKVHVRIHSEEGKKPFPCILCGKKFSQQGNLNMHTFKIHKEAAGNKKTFKCKSCNKVFRTETGLNGHICWICEVCKKHFSDKAHLIRHIRTHSSEKPFECKDCGKKYTQKGKLKHHIKSHSGE